MSVKLPKTLKIGHQTYNVVVDNDMDALGMCRANVGRISIRTHTNNKEPVSDSLIADTLLHEVLHAIEFQLGRDTDEDMVNTFATALLSVIRDNRQFHKILGGQK